MAARSEARSWIADARRGDAVAVSKLLATFHPILRNRAEARMGQGLRARLEPEDILQQAYLDVFQRIDRFEGTGPDTFLNWVLTIVDSKVVDAGRALRRQLRDIARECRPEAGRSTDSYWNLFDQVYGSSRTPSRVIRRDEALGALLASVSNLSEAHREVLELRFLYGHSVAEVADRLGKSEPAVVALTMRALEALRKAMDHLGEFTHG